MLQDYYSILDSTGDHDTDDPTEEKEEDADDDEQMADAGAVPAAKVSLSLLALRLLSPRLARLPPHPCERCRP